MKLNEAITHLREELANPAHDWGCEECKAEHEQLLEWLEDYKRIKDLSDSINKENDIIIKKLEEAELKDLKHRISTLKCGIEPIFDTYKEDCYYYTEVQDMGAHIKTCSMQDRIGICPCNGCSNYLPRSKARKIIDAYRKEKQNDT